MEMQQGGAGMGGATPSPIYFRAERKKISTLITYLSMDLSIVDFETDGFLVVDGNKYGQFADRFESRKESDRVEAVIDFVNGTLNEHVSNSHLALRLFTNFLALFIIFQH